MTVKEHNLVKNKFHIKRQNYYKIRKRSDMDDTKVNTIFFFKLVILF